MQIQKQASAIDVARKTSSRGEAESRRESAEEIHNLFSMLEMLVIINYRTRILIILRILFSAPPREPVFPPTDFPNPKDFSGTVQSLVNILPGTYLSVSV